MTLKLLKLGLWFLQWCLAGLLAWSLWAPAKLVILFWELGKPFCEPCYQLPNFLVAGFLFGLAVWFLADPRRHQVQFASSGLGCLILLAALALPSVLLIFRPWQIFILSLIVAFNLSLIIDRWPQSRIGPGVRIFWAGTLIFLYTWLGFQQWQNFAYPAQDVGVFHQALWHLSRQELPASSLKNLPNLWGDHFHPVLLVFMPFYRFLGFPGVLLAQAVAVGLGFLAVVAIGEKLTASSWMGLFFGLSYGLFFGFQEAINFGFSPEIILPMALAFALYGLTVRSSRIFILMAVLALTTKENVGLYLVFLGLLAWFRNFRRPALTVSILGAAWFLVTTQFLIPAFGSGTYLYHPNISFQDLINPLWLFRRLTFPALKLETLSLSLLSFGLLPLGSLMSLLPAIPMILERFLPEVFNRWTTNYHYSLALAPILVWAALQSSLSFPKKTWLGKDINQRIFLTFLVFTGAILITLLDHRPLTKLSLIKPGPYREDLAYLNHLVAPGASLAATNALVPHLASREQVFALPNNTRADYIVFADDLNLWPLSLETLNILKKNMITDGYQLIYRSNLVEVFLNPTLGN